LNTTGLAAARLSGGSEFHAAGPAREKERVNKFTLLVLMKDDELLKSTMEGGKLLQIRAIRPVKKMTSDIHAAYIQ